MLVFGNNFPWNLQVFSQITNDLHVFYVMLWFLVCFAIIDKKKISCFTYLKRLSLTTEPKRN